MLRLLAHPYLLLSLAALFWGGNTIVGRWLRDYLSPVDINLIRWSLALMILLPFCWGPLWRERALMRRHWLLIVLLGVTGVAVFQTLLYLSLQTTSAINASLITSTCPIMITLGNGLLYREWLSAKATLGVLISLIGVVVLISHGQWANVANLQFYPGDLWMLLANLVWAIYSIGLRHKPAQLSQASLLLSTAIVGLLVLLPWGLLETNSRDFQPLNTTVYLNLFYVVLFPSILAFICWNRGVALIGSGQAGIFLHLIPVFTAGLSVIFLGEGVAAYHLLGALLVFGGIALTARQPQ